MIGSIPTDRLDVRLFGAKGDGSTDDLAAVRNAYTTAAASGKPLYFPDGTYLVKTTSTFSAVINVTTAGVRIIGSGKATLKAHGSSASGIRLIQVGADDVQIDGLGIDPNGVSNGTGVYISGASRTTVRNCRITNPRSGGVHIVGGVFDLLVTGNQVTGAAYGVLANDPATGGRWSFTNNVLRGAGSNDGDGIEINCPTTGITDVLIADNLISNYQAINQNGGFGIGLANVQRATISGNHVSGCSRNGIHLEDGAADVTITGNTVHDCGNAGIELQAILDAEGSKYTESVTVTGNTVYKCCQSAPLVSPPQGFGGIEVGKSTASKGVVIANNTSVANGTASIAAAGIYVYECPNSVITGNLCKNNNGPGIDATSIQNTVIIGNRCLDNQAVKTQTYGLKTFGSGSGTLIAHNNFAGNLTGAVSNGFSTAPTWHGNVGFASEANGTATIASGTTSIVVTHGLGITPALKDIRVTPTNNLGSAAKFWVSSPTSTQFTINVNVDPGATTATFAWEAVVR